MAYEQRKTTPKMSVNCVTAYSGIKDGSKLDLNMWNSKLALNFSKFVNEGKPDNGFIGLNAGMASRFEKLLTFIVHERLDRLAAGEPYSVVSPIEIPHEIYAKSADNSYQKKTIGTIYVGAEEFPEIGNRVYIQYKFGVEKDIKVVLYSSYDFEIPESYLGNYDKHDEDLYRWVDEFEKAKGRIFFYNLGTKMNESVIQGVRSLLIQAGLIQAPNYNNGGGYQRNNNNGQGNGYQNNANPPRREALSEVSTAENEELTF